MNDRGFYWRARVGFAIATGIPILVWPTLLLGVISNRRWSLPNPERYQWRVTTPAGVHYDEYTRGDMIYNSVIAPILGVLMFVSVVALGAFHSYRWLRRYEPFAGASDTFLKSHFAVVAVLALLPVIAIAINKSPSLISWLLWLLAMAASAALLLFSYRKLEPRLRV